MTYLTREQAIEQAGIQAIEAVEAMNCEPTGRITDDGTMEFRASVALNDEEGSILEVYYFQDEETAMQTEDLSDLQWEIHGYRII